MMTKIIIDKIPMCPSNVCLQVLYYNHFSYNYRPASTCSATKHGLVYTGLTITRITRLQKFSPKFAFNEYKQIYNLCQDAHQL